MDEISQGPKWDFRLPSRRWLAVAAAVSLVAAIAVVVVTGTGGRHAARSTSALAAASSSPHAAPGTVLLTCENASWIQLSPNWRAGSLNAGALWLVDARQNGGYAQYGRLLSEGRARPPQGSVSVQVSVLAEVAAGSTVAMKAAADTRSYFHFLNRGSQLPAGDTGFTLVACPHGDVGPNGLVTDFYLGFTIDAGRVAPVEVLTSASARPIWLTFTPDKG